MSNLLGIWRYAINHKRCDPAEERMLGVLHGSREFEHGIIPQIRILGEGLAQYLFDVRRHVGTVDAGQRLVENQTNQL